jgi:hypothetical protein
MYPAFRWKNTGDSQAEYYVCRQLNLVALPAVADPSDTEGETCLTMKLADPQQMGNYQTKDWFYMKESDLQAAPENAPDVVTLYSEYIGYDRSTATVFSVTVSKNAKAYYNAFYNARYRPVAAFNPTATDNPFGTYANSADDSKRYFIFLNMDVQNYCTQYLSQTSHISLKTPHSISNVHSFNQNQLSAAALISSANINFYTTVDPGTPVLPTPSSSRINQTNIDYFDNNYILINHLRTLCIGKLNLGRLDDFNPLDTDKQSSVTVMRNASPHDVAVALGLDTSQSYEWIQPGLSLFGAFDNFRNTGEVDNLILGTAQANAQVLLLETRLRSLVAKGDTLFVQAIVDCNQMGTSTGGPVYASWSAHDIHFIVTLLRRTANDADSGYSPNNSDPRKWYTFHVHINPLTTEFPTVAEQLLVQVIMTRAFESDVDELINDFEKYNQQAGSTGSTLFVKPAIQQPRQLAEKTMEWFGKPDVLTTTETSGDTIYHTTNGNYFQAAQNQIVDLTSLFNGLSANQGTLLLFDLTLTIVEKQGVYFLALMGQLDTQLNDAIDAFAALVKYNPKVNMAGSVYFKNPVDTVSMHTKLDPLYIDLEAVDTYTIPLQLGNHVMGLGIGLQVSLGPDYTPGGQTWVSTIRASGTMAFHNLDSAEPILLELTFLDNSGALRGFAEGNAVRNIFGFENLNLDYLSAAFEYSPNIKTFDLLAQYTPVTQTFQFGGKLSGNSYGLYCKLDHISLEDINGIFASLTDGEQLQLPDADWNLQCSDVRLSICNTDGFSVDGESLPRGFNLRATVAVQNHTEVLSGNFTEKGLILTGDTADQIALHGLELTNGALMVMLSTGAPVCCLKGGVQYAGMDLEGAVYLAGIKENNPEVVVVATIDTATFGLDNIFPEASNTIISALQFSEACLVATDYAGTVQIPQLPGDEAQDKAIQVAPGLWFHGKLASVPYAAKLIHDNLDGSTVTIQLDQPNGVGSFDIHLPETASLDLGNALTCEPVQTVTVPLSPQPAIQLPLNITLNNIPNQSPVQFGTAAMDLNVARASASAIFQGTLQNFMGIEGLNPGPESTLQVDLLYSQFANAGLPNDTTLVSGLAIPDLPAIPVSLDISQDQVADIMRAGVGNLGMDQIQTLIAYFSGSNAASGAHPGFWQLNDAMLFFVPKGGQLGAIQNLEPGVHLGGNLLLWGNPMPNPFMGTITRNPGTLEPQGITLNPGLVGAAEFSSIKIGLLSLSGKASKPGVVQLNYASESLALQIEAAIMFMGRLCDGHLSCQYSANAQQVDMAFVFKFDEYLFCTVQGTATGDVNDPSTLDFSIQSSFGDDLVSYIQGMIIQKFNEGFMYMADTDDFVGQTSSTTDGSPISQAAMSAQEAWEAALSKPKSELVAAQNNYIAYFQSCQENYRTVQATYRSDLIQAELAVLTARQQFDTALDAAQLAVVQAQYAYNMAMRNAEKAVDEADVQYLVNVGNAQINLDNAKEKWDTIVSVLGNATTSAANYISELNNEIAFLQNQAINGPWYKVNYFNAMKTAREAARTSTQTMLHSDQSALNNLKDGDDYEALLEASNNLEAVKTQYRQLCDQAGASLQETRTGTAYNDLMAAQSTLSNLQNGAPFRTWQAAKEALAFVRTASETAMEDARRTLKHVADSEAKHALDTAAWAVAVIADGPLGVNYFATDAAYTMSKYSQENAMQMAEALINAGPDGFYVNSIQVTYPSLKSVEAGTLCTVAINYCLLGKTCNISVVHGFNFMDLNVLIQIAYQDVLQQLSPWAVQTPA